MTTNTTEDAPANSLTKTRFAGRPLRRALLGAVLVSGLLLVGYRLGLGSPWSAHDPTVVKVSVKHVPAEVPWGMFVQNEDQVQFRLDDVVWRSGDESDDGGSIPTCLRQEGASVEAEVGMIEVNRPFGSGSYWQVLSLTCPSGN